MDSLRRNENEPCYREYSPWKHHIQRGDSIAGDVAAAAIAIYD